MARLPCIALLSVSLAAVVSLPPAGALSTHPQAALDSEHIAASALSVAEATHTSGRCYAAVCRALRPLGVDLHGAAAYQARDLLLKDKRFVPLLVNSVDELRTGDIIVYTRSHTHPYGHISVYEGNYEEASDHISAVTHTQAYGGATVFRLRNEYLATNWHPAGLSSSAAYQDEDSEPAAARQPQWRRPEPPPSPGYQWESGSSQGDGDGTATVKAVQFIRKQYRLISGEPIERSLVRRCARYLMNGY